jgi:hypothetical protein
MGRPLVASVNCRYIVILEFTCRVESFEGSDRSRLPEGTQKYG